MRVLCLDHCFFVCTFGICAITSVLSVRCYQCYMVEHPYFIPEGVQVKTCKDFDYSENFIQDCPESTFCFKKTATDYFYKQKFIREERGCAQQTYRTQTFDFKTGWRQETYVVSDAYKNGCKMVEDYGLKSIEMEMCYCNESDFCNSSQSLGRFNSMRLICLFLFPTLMFIMIK